jgi:hypothetical protein
MPNYDPWMAAFRDWARLDDSQRVKKRGWEYEGTEPERKI